MIQGDGKSTKVIVHPEEKINVWTKWHEKPSNSYWENVNRMVALDERSASSFKHKEYMFQISWQSIQ